jgi:hypothetical protein
MKAAAVVVETEMETEMTEVTETAWEVSSKEVKINGEGTDRKQTARK